jgi:hypothetical protein
MLGSHPRGARKHHSRWETSGRKSIAVTIGDFHSCPNRQADASFSTCAGLMVIKPRQSVRTSMWVDAVFGG